MPPTSSAAVRAAACSLPRAVSVLCGGCSSPVPLMLFVSGPSPARQVPCPSCNVDVVLHDAW